MRSSAAARIGPRPYKPWARGAKQFAADLQRESTAPASMAPWRRAGARLADAQLLRAALGRKPPATDEDSARAASKGSRRRSARSGRGKSVFAVDGAPVPP